jgi:hypothetical protein
MSFWNQGQNEVVSYRFGGIYHFGTQTLDFGVIQHGGTNMRIKLYFMPGDDAYHHVASAVGTGQSCEMDFMSKHGIYNREYFEKLIK